MASTTISICSLMVMSAAAILTVYAFYYIFKKQQMNEQGMDVIQRQLRGFALLMVANLVMIIGMMVCAGTLLPEVMKLLR